MRWVANGESAGPISTLPEIGVTPLFITSYGESLAGANFSDLTRSANSARLGAMAHGTKLPPIAERHPLRSRGERITFYDVSLNGKPGANQNHNDEYGYAARTVFAEYDSLTAIRKVSDNFHKFTCSTGNAAANSLKGHTGSNWYGLGIYRFQHAMNEIKDGIPRGMAQFRKFTDSLEAQFQIKGLKHRRKRIKGDFGDDIRIGAIMSGNLDRAYMRTKKENTKRKGNSKKVHIALSTRLFCGADAKTKFYQAATALKLMKVLRRKGYTVAFSTFSIAGNIGSLKNNGVNNRYNSVNVTKLVKLGSKVITVPVVTGVLPLWTRTIGYIADSCLPISHINMGLGIPVDIVNSKLVRDYARNMYGTQCRTIFLPELKSEREAAKWYRKQVTETFKLAR